MTAKITANRVLVPGFSGEHPEVVALGCADYQSRLERTEPPNSPRNQQVRRTAGLDSQAVRVRSFPANFPTSAIVAVALFAGCSPATTSAVWAWLDGPGFAWFVGFLAALLVLTAAAPVLARLVTWYEGPRPLIEELTAEIDEAEKVTGKRYRPEDYRAGWDA